MCSKTTAFHTSKLISQQYRNLNIFVWMVLYVAFNNLLVISRRRLLAALDSLSPANTDAPSVPQTQDTSTPSGHIIKTSGHSILVLSSWACSEKTTSTNSKNFGLARPGFEPATSQLQSESSIHSALQPVSWIQRFGLYNFINLTLKGKVTAHCHFLDRWIIDMAYSHTV